VLRMKISIPVLGLMLGGGVRVIIKLANYLAKQHDVTIYSIYESTAPWPYEGKLVHFVSRGSRWYRHSSPWVRAVVFLGFCFWYLLHGARGAHQIATHNLTVFPVCFGAIFARKSVYYIQAYESEIVDKKGLVGFLLKTYCELTYRLPFTRIVNSNLYKNYGKLRAKHVLPPGIDLDVFYFKPREPLSYPIVLGVIGRREKWKGSEIAIRAFEILFSAGHDVRLSVCFGSSQCDMEPSLSGGISISEPVGDIELSDYYRSVDILLAPGRLQFGAPHYPVIESLAVGTLVVTTGYFPSEATNAELVPHTDDDSLLAQRFADAVLVLISSGAESMNAKRNSGRSAVQSIEWSALATELETLLRTDHN
jgi:glycosyltransferase involved in cell wall biosynthesis